MIYFFLFLLILFLIHYFLFQKDLFYFHIHNDKGVSSVIATPAQYENFFGFDLVLSSVKSDPEMASYWIINYDNADYLKADSNGKCNDSNIILDGTTNTSCH